MFSDESKLIVNAGSGGNGIVSFRKEKYVPYGGPDGGDGGKGGDVILKVNKNLRTLSHIKSRYHFRAKNGKNGSGKKCTGQSGDNLIIELPLGTVITDKLSGNLLGDLNKENDFLVIVRGGRGGKGNYHFVSSLNRAPKNSQEGEDGEYKQLFLELKIIADVGFVGFPNSGKSTLLSKLSNAKPQIANYPFTTLYPNLGIVYEKNYQNYVVADIPGLIEGAHKGFGLGIRFLKHIERTKVLLFIIDIFEKNPFQKFKLLINELSKYKLSLIKKPYAIALNKIDLFSEKKINILIKDFEKHFPKSFIKNIFNISAFTGKGILQLKHSLFSIIQKNTKI